MKGKGIMASLILMLLLACMLTITLHVQPVKAELGTIVVPDDYAKIQWALGNATAGDTVFVKAGTYYEHVVVDKAVSLIGAGESNTIIDGNGTGNVITITANNVNLTGFTIQNSGFANAGIYLDHSSNNIVSGNNITNNEYGIYLYGSSNNSMVENTITANNWWGVGLDSSSNYNSVVENNITNNNYGIWLDSSFRNTITENEITANNEDGTLLVSSMNNSIVGNNITNNYVGIELESSSNNNIVENKITANTEYGIYLASSLNNTVSGNNITNSEYGIYLYYSSSYNSVIGNNITNNAYGIYLVSSSGNKFYYNNFVGNTQQVHIERSGYANFWDNGYPSGGNYWSDYKEKYPNATELDESGIWSTPYVIDENNTDNYPLIHSYPYGPDVAIINITPSALFAYPTWTVPLKINITIANKGDYNETFPLTLYWNNTNLISTKTATLKPHETKNVTFTWTVPSIPKAYPYPTYVLSANATVPGNINSGILIGGSVTVKWPGDANGDGHVNGFDLYIMAVSWHSQIGAKNYDPRADINGDGAVNGFDLYWMAVNWHRGPLD